METASLLTPVGPYQDGWLSQAVIETYVTVHVAGLRWQRPHAWGQCTVSLPLRAVKMEKGTAPQSCEVQSATPRRWAIPQSSE